VSPFGAVYSNGTTRAFCGGFAAFGLAYLALAMGPWAAEQVGPHLASTRLLRYAGPRIDSTPQAADQVLSFDAAPSGGSTVEVLGKTPYIKRLFAVNPPRAAAAFTARLVFTPAATDAFMRAGHCLFAVLPGALGGVVARRFAAPRHEDMPDREERPSPTSR
jgi:hypothetical protein